MMRTGFDGAEDDDGPWKPPASTLDKVQSFLLGADFAFDYSLPRYMCQICKLRGNQHEMLCCDGKPDTQNRACCGVSFHKICIDPLRSKPWEPQTEETDNFLCDQCYDFDDDDSTPTEEHASDCECGACVSEYLDSDGNLADLVVPDCEAESEPSHDQECDCEICTSMREADRQWAAMRLRDAPDGRARAVADAIDKAQKRFERRK